MFTFSSPQQNFNFKLEDGVSFVMVTAGYTNACPRCADRRTIKKISA
jgi:hypothetical protein